MEERSSASSLDLNALLCEGVAAAKAGEGQRAQELLMRVVAQDERNASAWLWLSGVVDSLEDREVCLENVLTIDPDNAYAQKGLAWVRQQMDQQEAHAPETGVQDAEPFTIHPDEVVADDDPPGVADPEPPVVARTRTPNSPAAAILREDFARQRAASAPEPSSSSDSDTVSDTDVSPTNESFLAATRHEFEDEYLCPYCASKTEPEDKRCQFCGQRLWIKFRTQEKRSKLLWTLLAIQLGNTLYLALIPVVVYLAIRTLPQMLGAPALLNCLTALAAVPALLSLGIAIGLYLRWKPIYYLFLAQALLQLISAIVAAGVGSPVMGIVGFVAAMIGVGMIFNLEGDFEQQRRRILFRLDRGLKSGVEYMVQADRYNQQRMWGLAALHIRAALGLMPDRVDCHSALVVAYIRLKRYDLAERALAQAQKMAPDDARLAELEQLLAELRSEAALTSPPAAA